MTEPLIYTIKGNLPIASLAYATRWDVGARDASQLPIVSHLARERLKDLRNSAALLLAKAAEEPDEEQAQMMRIQSDRDESLADALDVEIAALGVPRFFKITETYQNGGETVRESAHVYQCNGVTAQSAAGSFQGA